MEFNVSFIERGGGHNSKPTGIYVGFTSNNALLN